MSNKIKFILYILLCLALGYFIAFITEILI